MADSGPRWLICVDYGTTFTGVAWVLTEKRSPTLADVKVVKVWAGGNNPKVPSEITYAASRGAHERWGFGLKDRRYVLSWTKMELEPPTRQKALLLLSKTLEEARLLGSIKNAIVDYIPIHLVKTAEEVVTDYLNEVAIKVHDDIVARHPDGAYKLTEFPIDLIITHPATWHRRAQNSTFRAAREAFKKVFPGMQSKPGKIMMTTEPEACAQYTMRVAQDQGMTGFRKGECFIVVDAGGGTVDLAAYRIDQLPPKFRMTKITEVTGGLFGATRIDEHFIKRFVPSRLRPADYAKLLHADGHGSGTHVVFTAGEQFLLDKFQVVKENFAGLPAPGAQSEHSWIKLPLGIGDEDDPERGIIQGQMRITAEDLVEIFRESVEGILHLITEQLVLVQLQNLSVRTVFLSGGFSRNQNLFHHINALTRNWGFSLVRGDEREITGEQNNDDGMWTAVVKGAALIGLGMGCDMPPPCVACPYYIGLASSTEFRDYFPEQEAPHLMYVDKFDGKRRLKDQTRWLVAKGDLITARVGIEKTVKICKKMTRTGNPVGSVVIIVSTNREQSHDAAPGHERRELLDYDLSIISQSDRPRLFHSITDHRTGVTYYKVTMEVMLRIDQQNIYLELLCGRTVDMLGNIGASGYRLASATIGF